MPMRIFFAHGKAATNVASHKLNEIKTTKSKQSEKGKRGRREHQMNVEDERGWTGQSGQRPANEEEKNYRPGGRQDSSPGRNS